MGDLLLGILITWRITALVTTERGPFDVFGRLRDALGVDYDDLSQCRGRNELAKALCCFWCTSLWVGFGVCLILHTSVAYGFAYSAGAIVIWEMSHGLD